MKKKYPVPTRKYTTVLLKRKNMNRKAANHDKNFEDAHAHDPFGGVSSHPHFPPSQLTYAKPLLTHKKEKD